MNKKEKWLLALILLFSFAIRVYRLGIPENYYFDEVYHAFTARAYANNDPRGYEWWHASPEEGAAYEWLHPPISKLLMAASIKMLGENSFAWRLPSAIFGTLVIYLVYVLAKEVFGNRFKKDKEKLALLAALLAAMDGLLLVQSRIAMNDIFLTAFLLLALIYYWKWFNAGEKRQQIRDLLISGLFAGLAMATKWSGVFILGIVGVMEIKKMIKNWKDWITTVGWLALSFVVLPVVIYLLSYGQFWLQGHSWEQFGELHNQIIRYELGLEATHPYQSEAWQWPLLLEPVWYQVDYSKKGFVGNVYALSNPVVSWFGLVAVFRLLIDLIRKKRSKVDIFLVVAYFTVWFPWIFSPRIMFYYHYTPAIPLLVIILAGRLYKLWMSSELGKIVSESMVGLAVAACIFFLPLWTGVPMVSELTKYFFWLPSWK